jgi:hypothetical protein
MSRFEYKKDPLEKNPLHPIYGAVFSATDFQSCTQPTMASDPVWVISSEMLDKMQSLLLDHLQVTRTSNGKPLTRSQRAAMLEARSDYAKSIFDKVRPLSCLCVRACPVWPLCLGVCIEIRCSAAVACCSHRP